jgi:hypothetical protein
MAESEPQVPEALEETIFDGEAKLAFFYGISSMRQVSDKRQEVIDLQQDTGLPEILPEKS